MQPCGPPTEQEIWKIARRTIGIIKSHLTNNVCLFGSAGTALWANIGRVPNDIDIVVSEDPNEHFDPEWIKAMIRRADYRYFLKPSTQHGAKYRILYCRLPGWATDHKRRVKLDILVPPTLGLPKIRASEAIPINGIPVMPVFDLLIMRTQGWWEHRISSRDDFKKKVKNDVYEIFALLKCARKEGVSYVNEVNKRRHSREFIDNARALVNSFVHIHGGHQRWKTLQFPVANENTHEAALDPIFATDLLRFLLKRQK